MARKKKDDSGENGKDKSGFPDKHKKHLSSEWMESSESKNNEELKKNLVQYEQAISAAEKDREADPKLNGLKDRATDLKKEIETADVYKLSIQELQAQIKYIVHVLEGRGDA